MMYQLGYTKPMPGAMCDRKFGKQMGIQGRYLFNEKGSVVYDYCRSMTNMTLVNFSYTSASGWTASKYGGCLNFNGSNNYGNLARSLQSFVDYNKAFSIAVWFKFHTFSAAGTYSLLGAVHQVGGVYDQFELDISSDKIRVIFTNVGAGSDGRIWDTTNTIGGSTTKQFYVVWTYDGLNATTSTKFYLNGVNQAVTNTTNQGDITQSMWQSGRLDKDVWVGRRNFSTGDQPYPGNIDQIIFFNRVITEKEVRIFQQSPWQGMVYGTDYIQEQKQLAALGVG